MVARRRSASRPVADTRYDEIVARIRQGDGRVTGPRRVIIATLLGADSHVTAEDLAEQVHQQLPDVHLSTVYRTLDTLEDMGVVEHVHLGHGRAVYHLSGQRHLHLVCDSCATVVEVPDSVFAEAGAALSHRYGFTIHPHHFAVPGLCADCSAVAGARTRHR